MNREDMFPGRFVGAADLKGRSVTAVISEIKEEEVGPQKDSKWVVYFEGKEKGLILNVTNADSIFEAYGDTEAWPGKFLELYPSRTKFAGKTVDCVRVRAPQTKTVEPEAADIVRQVMNDEPPPLTDDDMEPPF